MPQFCRLDFRCFLESSLRSSPRRSMLEFIPLCWLCSLSTVLVPHDSNIDSRAQVCWLPFACCICRYGLDQAKNCPANAIALHIVPLLCCCKKDNLCSLLDSGRPGSWPGRFLISGSPRVQPWVWGFLVWGKSASSFPEQRLVMKPNN